MILTTMSRRWGIPKSLLKLVFLRAGRVDIQSSVSAAFSRLTMNSVMACLSKLRNTLEVVRCQQHFNNRRSKLGWLISFWRYPLTRYSQKVSKSTVDPSLIDTTDTSGSSAYTFDPRLNFCLRITAVAIQRCHTQSLEDVYVRGAKKHSHYVTFFLNSHLKYPMWLCPIDAARQKPRIHPVRNDGLKQATIWIRTGYVENTGQMYTNQDLVAWSRNIHVDPDSRQSKLHPS